MSVCREKERRRERNNDYLSRNFCIDTHRLDGRRTDGHESFFPLSIEFLLFTGPIYESGLNYAKIVNSHSYILTDT